MLDSTPTIHRAARVITLDGPATEALAVLDDRVAATGSIAELRDRYPSAPEVDHGDTTIVPGFNDAHCHMAIAADATTHLDVAADLVGTVDELLEAVRGRAAATPANDWVFAFRYDDARTGLVTRDDLDRVAPANPVLIRQVSGHWAVLNSAALAALDIDEDTPPLAEGEHGFDADGRLDGRLFERSLFDRYSAKAGGPLVPIPTSSLEEQLAGYESVTRLWTSLGITSICDALVGPTEMRIHAEARRRGIARIRVGMLLDSTFYDEYRGLALPTDLGDEHLRVAGVKLFADGAVGGRTCFLSEPFEDSDSHGLQFLSTEQLDDLVSRVHADGNRVAVHANGDAAIRLVLDVYERAAATARPGSPRHRIEHCSVIDDEIVERLARLGVIAVPFAGYASHHGPMLRRSYGEERVSRMFAHASLLRGGVTVAASSDHPAGPISPFHGLHSMVTRTALADGLPVGAEQRISAEDALRVYTTGSAEATGEADRKGLLRPGMLADFVALDRDPLTIPGEELAEIEVAGTWIGGEAVYERTGALV